MALDDERLELPGFLRKDDDYTFYLERAGDPPRSYSFTDYHNLLESHRFATHDFSAACSGRIFSPDVDRQQAYIEGRMLICRCYRGTEIAVTLRELDRKVPPHVYAKERDPEWNRIDCRYSKADEKVPFPVTIETICREIVELTLKEDSSGLVLVTGSTNSAKSELARGLIVRVLERQTKQFKDRKRRRRPHLLTFEDPIEKWLFQPKGKDANSGMALSHGVEYTPREKGVDVGSLKEAVDDALRQTPSIFYIGEIREDADWAEVLRFAGTGHLVIATSHAGSLIEAMERIFRGGKADTPAARGQIAQRLLAVIHQVKFNLADLMPGSVPAPFEVLLPAIWRRTSSGVAALVSDGLSSVLPNAPKDVSERETVSTFGRRWFAEQIQTDHWTRIFERDFLSLDAQPGLKRIRRGPRVNRRQGHPQPANGRRRTEIPPEA